MIDKIIWIHNYEKKYDPFYNKSGISTFTIGNLINSNELFVNSTSNYFSDYQKMIKGKRYENLKKVKIFQFINGFYQVDIYSFKDLDEFKKFNFQLEFDKILLDIDFDYFSSNNPGLSELSLFMESEKLATQILKVLDSNHYKNKKFKNLPNSIQKQLQKIKRTENEKILLILHAFLFKCFGIEKKHKFFKCSQNSRILWNGEGNIKKLQWEMNEFMISQFELDSESEKQDIIRKYFSSPYLPYFVLSENEIRKKIGKLRNFFKGLNIKKNQLKFISLAKSKTCGHTPAFLINFIKWEIYQFLEDFLN